MKNYLLNLLICFFFYLIPNSNLYASHAAGMDISFECISRNSTSDFYKITVSFYRDCNNTAAPGFLPLEYSSSCGSGSQTMPLSAGPTYITPICTQSGSPCSGSSSLVEIEEYQYEKLITLDHCDNWVFTVCIQARNWSITTINQPGNQYLCVRAELNNLNFCNNSPVFTEYPAPYICVNEPFCFNNGAFDIDGDSLVYSLEAPLNGTGVNDTVDYLTGYSSVSPVMGNTTFDASAGNLCMTASLSEVSVVAMKISEYRNGVFIGSVIRDIQIIILPCTTVPPVLSGFNGFPQDVTNSDAMDDSLNLCTDFGDTISFSIDAQIGSSNNKIMSWSGIPSSNSASFTITNNFSNNPSGTFFWVPQPSDVQNSPISFNITVQDDACPINNIFSYTYTITLSSSSTFVITPTVTDESCYGYGDGSIHLTVTGTDSIPQYNWVGPNGYVNINKDINGLRSGLYDLLITDISGCFLTDSFYVTSPNPLNVSFNIDSISCSGFNDGAINTTITGASSFADVSWSALTSQSSSWVSFSNDEDIDSLYSGFYAIIIFDTINNNQCTYYDTIEVVDPNPYNASFNITEIGCNNGNDGSIDLSVSGNTTSLTYNWTGPNSFASINQDISNLYSGIYYITISNPNGCIYNDSLFLTNPLPLSSSTSMSTCYSYFWNGATYNFSGTYSWNGINSNGCDSTANLNLTIYDSSVVNISVSACENYFWNGTSYNSSGTYLWQGVNINGCDSIVYLDLTINNHLFNEVTIKSCSDYNWNGTIYNQSGIYYDTLVNFFGCDSVVKLSLVISEFSISANTPICKNDSTQIDLYITNPTSNQYDILINNYSFTVDSLGLLSSTANPIMIKLFQNIDFVLISAQDESNCIAYPDDSVFVLVNELPDLSILLDDICDNQEPFLVTQVEPLGGLFYLDNQLVDSIFPSELSLGYHTLSYYYTDSNTSCSNMIDKEIEMLDAPDAQMLINPEIGITDSLITFHNISSNYVSSSWSLGDGYTISGVSEFTYSYSDFGQYIIELTVYGANNCIDIATNYVTVYPTYSVYIPNSFSPDSDMINESFYPIGIGVFSYEMTIYDRWGGVVFNQPDTPWLAEDVAQGIYTYIININDYNNQVYTYNGTIRVIR